ASPFDPVGYLRITANHGKHLVFSRSRVTQVAGKCLVAGSDVPIQRRHENPALVLECLVQASGRQPRGITQVGNRRGVVATLAEDEDGGIKHLVHVELAWSSPVASVRCSD